MKTTELVPMLNDLNLGYPTWLFLLDWVVKTVIPFTQNN